MMDLRTQSLASLSTRVEGAAGLFSKTNPAGPVTLLPQSHSVLVPMQCSGVVMRFRGCTDCKLDNTLIRNSWKLSYCRLVTMATTAPKAGRAVRIVSVLPSATEIVCAIGGAHLLVGRSHEDNYPSSITDRPMVTSQVGGAGCDGRWWGLLPWQRRHPAS